MKTSLKKPRDTSYGNWKTQSDTATEQVPRRAKTKRYADPHDSHEHKDCRRKISWSSIIDHRRQFIQNSKSALTLDTLLIVASVSLMGSTRGIERPLLTHDTRLLS